MGLLQFYVAIYRGTFLKIFITKTYRSERLKNVSIILNECRFKVVETMIPAGRARPQL